MLAFVLVLLAGCGGSADPYSGAWIGPPDPPWDETQRLKMTIEKKEDDEWFVRLGEYRPGVGWGRNSSCGRPTAS